jgi:hypothetical protein
MKRLLPNTVQNSGQGKTVVSKFGHTSHVARQNVSANNSDFKKMFRQSGVKKAHLFTYTYEKNVYPWSSAQAF